MFKKIVYFITLALMISVFLLASLSQAAPRGSMNPDISATFLGLYQNSSRLSDDRTVVPHNGFTLQEAEIQFTADIDPYLRAMAVFAFAQENGSTEFAAEPEEVYLETISLPRVTLKAGKFRTAFGRHNTFHTHIFPFIDAPVIHQKLLGDEGLNESGVSAAVLVPAKWYSEVTVQGISLSNSNMFGEWTNASTNSVSGSRNSGNVGALVHLKNLWDLTSDSTFEFGATGVSGKNSFDLVSSFWGIDMTYKWRPNEGGKYQSYVWSMEFLSGNRKGFTDGTTGASTENLGGIATWFQWQFAQRWWAQARYEYFGLPHPDAIPHQIKESILLGFFPSEFSGIRLQLDNITTQRIADDELRIGLQYNVSIGAHPAHTY
ncbi:MAG: hypothetical protein A4S09_15740 [Proteobacteria bacterium SG_bin7]|nr:MAG: hypothetical protein A4S09_15740 [Proteobacteria bacterium SG_bin7]